MMISGSAVNANVNALRSPDRQRSFGLRFGLHGCGPWIEIQPMFLDFKVSFSLGVQDTGRVSFPPILQGGMLATCVCLCVCVSLLSPSSVPPEGPMPACCNHGATECLPAVDHWPTRIKTTIISILLLLLWQSVLSNPVSVHLSLSPLLLFLWLSCQNHFNQR